MVSAKELIRLIDLTRLNLDDTEDDIIALCQQAQTPLGPVAAVCVYPKFIATAKQQLVGTNINIATVINFPHGDQPLTETVANIKSAIEQGADELDIVIPYRALQAGDIDSVKHYLFTCYTAGSHKVIKWILESGELDAQTLHQACTLAIETGGNFLKTSTGKTTTGATLEAGNILLAASQNHPEFGIKFSGGIRQQRQAHAFIELVAAQRPAEWLTSAHLRFGASSLLTDILNA